VPVSSSLVRDLPYFCDPFYKPKVLYRPVTLLPSMGSFRLHAVYHVPSDCRFCLSCTNTSYVTLGFFILHTIHFDALDLFLFSSLVVREVALVAFSGNNASLHFGVGVLFHSGLICVIN